MVHGFHQWKTAPASHHHRDDLFHLCKCTYICVHWEKYYNKQSFCVLWALHRAGSANSIDLYFLFLPWCVKFLGINTNWLPGHDLQRTPSLKDYWPWLKSLDAHLGHNIKQIILWWRKRMLPLLWLKKKSKENTLCVCIFLHHNVLKP